MSQFAPAMTVASLLEIGTRRSNAASVADRPRRDRRARSRGRDAPRSSPAAPAPHRDRQGEQRHEQQRLRAGQRREPDQRAEHAASRGRGRASSASAASRTPRRAASRASRSSAPRRRRRTPGRPPRSPAAASPTRSPPTRRPSSPISATCSAPSSTPSGAVPQLRRRRRATRRPTAAADTAAGARPTAPSLPSSSWNGSTKPVAVRESGWPGRGRSASRRSPVDVAADRQQVEQAQRRRRRRRGPPARRAKRPAGPWRPSRCAVCASRRGVRDRPLPARRRRCARSPRWRCSAPTRSCSPARSTPDSAVGPTRRASRSG